MSSQDARCPARAVAVAEKTAALLMVDYLEERAAHADEKILDRLLKRVPDRPAAPGDELPENNPKPQEKRNAAARRKRPPRRG